MNPTTIPVLFLDGPLDGTVIPAGNAELWRDADAFTHESHPDSHYLRQHKGAEAGTATFKHSYQAQHNPGDRVIQMGKE